MSNSIPTREDVERKKHNLLTDPMVRHFEGLQLEARQLARVVGITTAGKPIYDTETQLRLARIKKNLDEYIDCTYFGGTQEAKP